MLRGRSEGCPPHHDTNQIAQTIAAKAAAGSHGLYQVSIAGGSHTELVVTTNWFALSDKRKQPASRRDIQLKSVAFWMGVRGSYLETLQFPTIFVRPKTQNRRITTIQIVGAESSRHP
jgi:hypothetical protein